MRRTGRGGRRHNAIRVLYLPQSHLLALMRRCDKTQSWRTVLYLFGRRFHSAGPSLQTVTAGRAFDSETLLPHLAVFAADVGDCWMRSLRPEKGNKGSWFLEHLVRAGKARVKVLGRSAVQRAVSSLCLRLAARGASSPTTKERANSQYGDDKMHGRSSESPCMTGA